MAMFTTLKAEIRRDWKAMLLSGLLFALLFQVLMLAALVLRFQALPNYVTFYDWPGNVAWIVQSTPSWSDIPSIVREEWLIEIGRMNYDYGNGISVWSLNVIPSRFLVLFPLGALVALCLGLVRRNECPTRTAAGLKVTTGFGALLVAMTNATMSWVVCCATPSWVVGLAMLGLGVSSSLAFQQAGPWLSGLGFGALIALTLYLAWRKSRPDMTYKGTPAHA